MNKPGVTLYYGQLRLQDKGCAIKGLVVCNSWNINAITPAKQSDSMLLSTVP